MSGRSVRAPIVILISGRGSNMRALVEHGRDPENAYDVRCVISDREHAPGLEVAKTLKIETQVVAGAKAAGRSDYDGELAAAIMRFSPELLVLAGFMRILSKDFIEKFAGRIVNVHPSLLPKYAGLQTHARVLAAGEPEHGATVHFVTEQLDGGPRILQARTPVMPLDDASSLAARVLSLEHRIYPLAVGWYCQGRLRCEQGHALFDGVKLAAPIDFSALGR